MESSEQTPIESAIRNKNNGGIGYVSADSPTTSPGGTKDASGPEQELMRKDVLLDEINSAIDKLFVKLATVTDERRVPSDTRGPNEEPTGSPLVRKLSVDNDRLMWIVDRLAALHQIIDL